ncbi:MULTISPECIES: hypothetical protein [unclassified Micrococcus]|uniref:hypothetical protein n=1 Tax=unclassified Micrococcus TaxID=2620948 RepID=UPI00077E09E0|nr:MULTISPECIES: hypothetical protein [unclassified Micrococcus]KYK00814.1 hypothetical protein AUV02_07570 [Micrococcus sp. CH3]KYK04865.1 hypothetical protein AUV08_01690 [Micrococcus sp. CH7]
MTTTEHTRPGIWISTSAARPDYVRISADIPNDQLAEAINALAAVVNAPADDTHAASTGTTLADEDACRRVDDVDQDGPDCEGPEGGESA